MNRQYYRAMIARGRGQMMIVDGKVVGIVTYHIGDDDEKYLFGDPWQALKDDPEGETVYIQQLLIKGKVSLNSEFDKWTSSMKEEFPNIKQVKWVRAPASFRKHGIKGEKPNVKNKNIRK